MAIILLRLKKGGPLYGIPQGLAAWLAMNFFVACFLMLAASAAAKLSLVKRAIVSGFVPILLVGHSNINSVAYGRNLPESTGASGDKIGTIEALIPIVSIQKKVNSMNEELKSINGDSNNQNIARRCNKILNEIPFIDDEIKFKRIFDEYSQGISYKQVYKNNNAFLVYYTKGFDGIDRPSIEIQDHVEILQGKQYGYRNEVWIGIDETRSELSYLLSQSDIATNDLNDLVDYITQTKTALDNYLQLVPPQQLDDVRKNKQ